MTRITNADQVILLLQAQLQARKKIDKKKMAAAEGVKDLKQPPLVRVKSIAGDEGLAEEEVHRALIGGVLTEEFGPAIANDPAFQRVIDNVMSAISGDARGNEMLKKAVAQLKASN